MAAAATAQQKPAEEAAKILDAAHASLAGVLCREARECMNLNKILAAYEGSLSSKPRKR